MSSPSFSSQGHLGTISSTYQRAGWPGLTDVFCALAWAWSDLLSRLLTPWLCCGPQGDHANFQSRASPQEGDITEKTSAEHPVVVWTLGWQTPCQGWLHSVAGGTSTGVFPISRTQVGVTGPRASHSEGGQRRSGAAGLWEDSCLSFGAEPLMWMKFNEKILKFFEQGRANPNTDLSVRSALTKLSHLDFFFLTCSIQMAVFALTAVPAAVWSCDPGWNRGVRGVLLFPTPPVCRKWFPRSYTHGLSLCFLLTPSGAGGVRYPVGGRVTDRCFWLRGAKHWGFHLLYLVPPWTHQGSDPEKPSTCSNFPWMGTWQVLVASPLGHCIQAIFSNRWCPSCLPLTPTNGAYVYRFRCQGMSSPWIQWSLSANSMCI